MRIIIAVALLALQLMPNIAARNDKAEFDKVDRMIVVGDVHGDFDRFKSVLLSADLIDSKLKWTGGETHLVQLGDIPDRGPDTLRIIELLQKLEKSAPRAGGRVHVLVGNHDAMNVYGDLRYVVEEEFKAFSTRNSEKLLEAYFKAEVDWIKKNTPKEEWPIFDETFRENWLQDKPPGYIEHRQNWAPDGKIGKWVRSKNAVLKIGDTLFVHAGISPTYADWSIKNLNQAVREELERMEELEESILTREDGPLWYRGMAMNPEEEEEEQVQAVLDHFVVKRIVIGHTPTPGIILPRFDGRVILADVGLSRYYGDHLACLEIERGKAYAIHRGERLELPDGDRDSFVAYLDTLSRLEPKNKAAQNWISRLKASLVVDEAREEN